VTLVDADSGPADDAETVAAAERASVGAEELRRVHGTLYRISGSVAEHTFAALLHREQAGYGLRAVTVHCADGVDREAKVFWATTENEFFAGAAPASEVAATIESSAGQSGPNIEYFARLLGAMRARGVLDPHLEAVSEGLSEAGAAALSAVLESRKAGDGPLAGALALAAAGPRSFPLGSAVPAGETHSVVVSLPTIAHCEGYEEGDPAVTSLVRHGYPRFVVHRLVTEAHHVLAGRLAEAAGPGSGLDPDDVIGVASERAARELVTYVSEGDHACVPPAAGLSAALERAGPGGGGAGPGGACVIVPASDAASLPSGPGTAWWAVVLPSAAQRPAARAFLQHTGVRISSRQAEAFLAAARGDGVTAGGPAVEADAAAVVSCVVDAVGSGVGPGDVAVCRSGMNAFYAAFKAINSVMRPRGRAAWLQIGWLYVDTTLILERFARRQAVCSGWDDAAGALPTADTGAKGGAEAHDGIEGPPLVVRVLDPTDAGAIAAAFAEHGHRLAGVVTEAPSNPLLQTVDLSALRGLCDEHGAALVVDPTMCSPFAVDVVRRRPDGAPLADVVVLSLTKYFGSDGTVMAGAVVRNPGSRLLAGAPTLWPSLARHVEAPFRADLSVIASQCGGARHVVEAASRSCDALARYLESRTDVAERVHWAMQAAGGSGAAFRAIARESADGGVLCGAIVSVVLRGGLEAARRFYDRLDAVKGPSFGIGATLVCPFALLAHYDMVATEDGRRRLHEAGVSPWLLRVSCGLEPTAAILAAVERALPDLPEGMASALDFR